MDHCFDIIITRVRLDKESVVPLYQQLADGIYDLWESGFIKKNEKLPPIRKLAAALNVNNVTVVNAYKYLEHKKIAYSIAGSGTYISELSSHDKPLISEQGQNHNSIANKRQALNINLENSELINFAHGSVSADLFPVNDFKLLFNDVLERDKGNAFGYEQIQGYEPLRSVLCEYVKGYKINTAADRIQIISGAQQGIDIVAKAMLSVGDVVFVEGPTYYGASGAFISRGAKVVEIPLQSDGMDINKLTAMIKLYKPKLLYIMPYFQTPTCINTSLEKKRKILELSNKYDFYIIEEDNQSEFNFTEEEIIPLKALDYKNKVIYIKSFSKILMPGLRLGFMVLPKNVLDEVLNAKYTTDIETSGFLQRAFHLYIQNKSFYSHINEMKDIFKTRYNIMKKNSEKYLKGKLQYQDPTGGLNYWYELPEAVSSSEFSNLLIQRNVIVYPGDIFSLSGDSLPFIRLSFANVADEKIMDGIKRIAAALPE